jgi:hypothetical protein
MMMSMCRDSIGVALRRDWSLSCQNWKENRAIKLPEAAGRWSTEKECERGFSLAVANLECNGCNANSRGLRVVPAGDLCRCLPLGVRLLSASLLLPCVNAVLWRSIGNLPPGSYCPKILKSSLSRSAKREVRINDPRAGEHLKAPFPQSFKLRHSRPGLPARVVAQVTQHGAENRHVADRGMIAYLS